MAKSSKSQDKSSKSQDKSSSKRKSLSKESTTEKPAEVEVTESKERDFTVIPENLSPISFPLADSKLKKKLLKVVKKAAKHKHVKRGIKEVVKGLRKGEKGLVLIAGNISPVDVISHVPVLCEDNNVPYIYVPSKEELGFAGCTKRPTSCVMVVPGGKGGKQDGLDEYKENYDECSTTVTEINSKVISTA
ncbi:H/ACA ribonucleoprotein complex subunit 2 [Smittium culicis]|uniref:H/ACA ribonucleoprotein complex subunit 2 n=1 Tax=Smittium culicis TaxID=133412 RepID=A0A1R1XWA1_9FUNG|nr:H/ACA ribonucleoprotein complex subunit 2 [Smittium culicis]